MRLASRLPLALVLTLGCGQAAMEPPTPDPLDPVDRTATLVWVLDESDPEALTAALDTLEYTSPTALLFGGENALDLAGPSSELDSLLALADVATEGLGRRVDLSVELPALAEPGPYCFDRQDPTADPRVAARAAALGAWLRARPAVRDVVLGFDRVPRAWDVDCSCATCESQLPNDLATRMTTLLAAFQEPVDREFRTLWWWDLATPGGPDSVDPATFMDAALGTVNRNRHLPVRLSAKRGPDHPWGLDNPGLTTARERRMAVDLDPGGSRFGPSGAALFLYDDLHDRVRTHRAASGVGWFVDLGGDGRRAAGDIAGEAGLRLVDALFRDLEADVDEVLTDVLADLAEPAGDDDSAEGTDLYDLAVALRGSGAALDIATHPLGVWVGGPSYVLPATFPLARVESADPAWALREAELRAPSRATSAAVHQWGAEARHLAASGLAALLNHEDALRPDAFEALRRGLATLDVWVRAWAVTVDADTALRFVQAASEGPARTEAYGWLRSDAARMRGLADELDAGLAADALALPVPVSSDALRSLAAMAELEAGPGPASVRPFPVLTAISVAQEEDRFTVRWEVAPPAGGSVEWGTRWPLYDDGGSGDAAPASRWSAWREEALGPELRVTYRACAPYEDELGVITVCSSDRAFWTGR